MHNKTTTSISPEQEAKQSPIVYNRPPIVNKPMRDSQTLIRITEKTKAKIKTLATKRGQAQVTVLEYLLHGKIDLKDLI